MTLVGEGRLEVAKAVGAASPGSLGSSLGTTAHSPAAGPSWDTRCWWGGSRAMQGGTHLGDGLAGGPGALPQGWPIWLLPKRPAAQPDSWEGLAPGAPARPTLQHRQRPQVWRGRALGGLLPEAPRAHRFPAGTPGCPQPPLQAAGKPDPGGGWRPGAPAGLQAPSPAGPFILPSRAGNN